MSPCLRCRSQSCYGVTAAALLPCPCFPFFLTFEIVSSDQNDYVVGAPTSMMRGSTRPCNRISNVEEGLLTETFFLVSFFVSGSSSTTRKRLCLWVSVLGDLAFVYSEGAGHAGRQRIASQPGHRRRGLPRRRPGPRIFCMCTRARVRARTTASWYDLSRSASLEG